MNLQEIKKIIYLEPFTAIHRKKLKKSDWDLIDSFISQDGDLQMKLNRLWNDSPSKPKNWLYISEFIQFILSRKYSQEASK